MPLVRQHQPSGPGSWLRFGEDCQSLRQPQREPVPRAIEGDRVGVLVKNHVFPVVETPMTLAGARSGSFHGDHRASTCSNGVEIRHPHHSNCETRVIGEDLDGCSLLRHPVEPVGDLLVEASSFEGMSWTSASSMPGAIAG